MTDPADRARVDAAVAAVEAGFADTPNPGPAFLQGSHEGCEPGESVAPFRAFMDWRAVPVEVLDGQDTALSFFSEGGFRFFLPAYLVADLRGRLQRAEPLFHLTGGFETTTVHVPAGGRPFARSVGGRTLLNPRRYGAITFEDYARFRLSVFCREEASAIVSYLRLRRETADLDLTRRAVDAALTSFWLDRAERAPSAGELAAHLEGERAYLDAITPK